MYKKWKAKANKIESNFKEFKNSALEKVKVELEQEYDKKYSIYKENIDLEFKDKLEKNEAELNDALEAANAELENTIKNVDDIIGIKVNELIDKSTLWMKCSCNDKLIPCEMDLSKPDDNTFKCQDCGAVYRVQFSYYPVLIKREINDNQLINILEKNKFKTEDK